MDGVWDKIDGYTESDNLDSSDEAGEVADAPRKKTLSTNPENSLFVDADEECSNDDVDIENGDNLQESLLSEMRQSLLHCNTEQRNTQEKVDSLSAEKKKQHGELSEMHHKAQVISKSARMSAGDVLSTITSSETMDIEENSQMEEYYDKIRSVQIEIKSTEIAPEKDSERMPSSSDINLPEITPGSTVVLNIGLMKSKANIARQGSMKARRKPTAMKRKSWTPGITELDLAERDETSVNVDETGESTTQEPLQRTDSCSPTDSSSEDEKEVSKPHMRSAIALPGLGDASKIQLQRSELKQRPTALHLVKTAKDAKENEIAKEDKTEMDPPPKPDWMKEVAQRKQVARPPRRKHVTLPARCTELDTLFEKRKNLEPMEGLSTAEADQTCQDNTVARESPRPKSFAGDEEALDPQLSKLFEKLRNLKPMEGVDGGNQERTPSLRPRSFHLDDREATELDTELFEKRRNLKPVAGGVRGAGEQGTINESPTVGQSVRSRNNGHLDKEVSGIFRARIHDGHTKLEPLPVSHAGHVKVAMLSEVKTNITHQEDGFATRSPAGQTRPSGQATVGQVGQVVEFVFDAKGGNRAMIGRVPPASHHQRPPGHNHQATPVSPRYDSQSPDDPGMSRPRSSHDHGTSKSRARTGHSVRSPTQERFPRPLESLAAGSTTGRPRHEPRSNQGISSENQTQPLSQSFIDQSSNHESSKGRCRSNHRVHSRDDDSSEKELYSKTTGYNSDPHGNTNTKSYHGNLPSILYVENNTPAPSRSRYTPHPPKRHELSHNHPPLSVDRNIPHPPSKSLVSNTPETQHSRSHRNHGQRYNGGLDSRAPVEENYIVSPPPNKLRRPTGRVQSSGHTRNSIVKDKQLNNRGFENNHGPRRMKSPEFYSSVGSDVDMDNQRTVQVKPVTITVKSICESPVRVQVKENGDSGVRNHVSSRVQVNGEGSRRNEGMGRPIEGMLDSQTSPSLDPVVPKWKQELKEKKRLQQGRQKGMVDMNTKKDNTEPEQSGNDKAEWQKRLKGIKKSWSDHADRDKDINENEIELENKSDEENDNERIVPGFLKEFNAKRTKPKVKVTVTAKSTPSHQDTRVNIEEDHVSSSNHDLGTYV